MKPSIRFYKGGLKIVQVVYFILFRYKIFGRENMPDGPALVCANHSSMADPILISIAAGKKHYIHYIAKIELFRVPGVSALVTKLGAISVDRDISDTSAVKASLGFLKKGEKIGVFPEGRRAAADDDVQLRAGAVKLAERTKSPIVPVFVPRKKSVFRRLKVTIGEPYYIIKQEQKRSAEDYAALTDDLMNKIELLGRG